MASLWEALQSYQGAGNSPVSKNRLTSLLQDPSVMDSYQAPQQPKGLLAYDDPEVKAGPDAIGPPSIAGGLLSLDPADYVGPNTLKSIGAGASKLAALLMGKGAALPMMAGIAKPGTVKILNWPEFQRLNPAMPVNDAALAWEKQARDGVRGVADDLHAKLRDIGITPSFGSSGSSNPFTYKNAIDGISSYMDVPGYGEVRISDHMRGSGLGNDRTFGNADDAFNSIKEFLSAQQVRNNQRQALRGQIGITDEMTRKEQTQRLQDWIAEQGFKGKDKDLYPWINKVGI